MNKFPDTAIAALDMPFKFKNKFYKLGSCGIRNDKAYAACEPHNEELVNELKARIQSSGNYTTYVDAGFLRFPDVTF